MNNSVWAKGNCQFCCHTYETLWFYFFIKHLAIAYE